jgi:hypothetical protein
MILDALKSDFFYSVNLVLYDFESCAKQVIFIYFLVYNNSEQWSFSIGCLFIQ